METATKKIPSGYKPSPLGIIPEDWEVKRLGEVCTFLDSQRIPIKDADRGKMQGKYPYYGASGIIDYVNDYIFDDDLILLGEDGANIITRSTPLAFLVSGKVWINNHAHVLKTNEGYDRSYICNYLESLSYDKYNTGTAQPKLNQEVCEHIPVLIPSEDEQNKISDLLTLWDTAITKQTALIEKLTLRKCGLMQQLLTGKKRLKGFEGEWSYHAIQDHFSEIRDKNDGKGHIPMTISAKLGLVSQTHKFDRVVAGNSLDNYTLLRKGDFAYNKGNSNLYETGCIYRLKEDSAIVPFVYICFRAIDNTCCEFYQQFFINHGLDKQLKQIITSGARGDGLLNVNSDDFMALKIPYPKVDEQIAIASILTDADKELEIQKQKLAAMQAQKKGLMQVLLTGKKRIK